MSRLVYKFATETQFEDLPPLVQHQAKRCFLDLTGVAAAGRKTALSKIIHEHAFDHFGAGKKAARLIFDARNVSPVGAALAGGMTIDSVDAHDGHPLNKGHAGCGVYPALLAMIDAEKLEISGQEFLTVLTIGYEISIRAGIVLHDTVSDYHTSGAWVAVGIAAMAARLLDMSYEQFREAIGIAEYHGPRSQMMRAIDAPTMVKDGSGWGAMAGVSAAYLAKAGFTGAPALTIEAETVQDHYDNLGQDWMIMGMYFKPYPVCRWGQPPVEAARQLKEQHGFGLEEIDRIEVQTFHEACRLAIGNPSNTEEAQYNLPFSVAAFLVFGKLGPKEVSEFGFQNPKVNALLSRIDMVEDQAFNDVFPAERWARVQIKLKDGRILTSEPSVGIGNAENPLSDDDLSSKFGLYCAEGGVSNVAVLADAIWQTDQVYDMRPLMGRILSSP